MKATAVLCLFAVVVLTSARPDGKKYTDKYDNVNVKEIVENHNLLSAYVKCMLGSGRCTAEGNELKSHITDALETFCEKCTEPQRDGTRTVIGHLINFEPEFWNQLTAKFDPQHKYTERYEKELKSIKA